MANPVTSFKSQNTPLQIPRMLSSLKYIFVSIGADSMKCPKMTPRPCFPRSSFPLPPVSVLLTSVVAAPPPGDLRAIHSIRGGCVPFYFG